MIDNRSVSFLLCSLDLNISFIHSCLKPFINLHLIRQRGTRPSLVTGIAGGDQNRRGSATSIGSTETSSSIGMSASGPTSQSAGGSIQQQMEQTAATIKGLIRRASLAGSDDAASVPKNANSTGADASASGVPGQSEEDTMKNLRKTFAGIFGDM